MMNKLKLALFFIKGSTPTAEELEEAKALELKNFLDIRLRNASAFKYTAAPEKVDAIAGTITEAIKKSYPSTPIITLDGTAPQIVNDPTGSVDDTTAKAVDEMTVDELVSYVANHEYEITGFSGMNKADKIAAIKAHEANLIGGGSNEGSGNWT